MTPPNPTLQVLGQAPASLSPGLPVGLTHSLALPPTWGLRHPTGMPWSERWARLSVSKDVGKPALCTEVGRQCGAAARKIAGRASKMPSVESPHVPKNPHLGVHLRELET